MLDEKVEAKQPGPSKAKGGKLAITVHLGKVDDKVEVLDTTEVWALRKTIKATFAKLLEPYDPAQLVVLAKDATGKLNPLGSKTVVAELGKDGNYEVWVEVKMVKVVEVPGTTPNWNDFDVWSKFVLKLLHTSNVPTGDEKELLGWKLARPATQLPFQADHLRREGLAAVQQLKETLTKAAHGETCQGLVFVTMGCPGIGKSRLCDEAAEILFPHESAVLLKVTYDVVTLSQLDAAQPPTAFLWRVIAGAYGVTDETQTFTPLHVPKFLDRVIGVPITLPFVYRLLEILLAPHHHWILAIDDLATVKFSVEHQQDLLSHCSQFVRYSTPKFLRCVLVTSFVPGTTDFLFGLRTPPIFIAQTLLSAAACATISDAFDPHLTEAKRKEAMLLSGGHPHALYKCLKHLAKHDRCPSFSELAAKLRCPPLPLDQVADIYKASFVPVPFTALSQDIHDQIEKGTVLFSPCTSSPFAKGWISMLMPLLCNAIDEATQDVYVGMKKLCRVGELDPTKQFERWIFQSEQVKSLMKLPMLPSLGIEGTLRVTLPPRRGSKGAEQKNYDWRTLTISSNVAIGDRSIFQQRGADVLVHPDYKVADEQMIICALPNHAYIKGQLCGTVEGQSIRVLFQSKINKDIEDSVGGLNKAAKLLADAGWKGLFLYLIVLGEEAELGTSHEHPTILVTPRHYNEFFSPTFSCTLELQHQIFQEKRVKKQKK